VSAGWGVILHTDGKITWCEPGTVPDAAKCPPHDPPPPVRADVLLSLYGRTEPAPGRLTDAVTEDAAVRLIADVLHRLRAHGHDPDTALHHAQTRFEAMATGNGRWD
jgi:hypothetical protein